MTDRWPGDRAEVEEREDEEVGPVEDEPDAEAEEEQELDADAEVDEPPAAEHAEGELDIPDEVTLLEGVADGKRRSVAIVAARFNGEITNRLLQSALDELDDAGVRLEAITVMPVPGAFELPLAAKLCAESGRYAGVACLGAVIRGETDHYDYVCQEAASGIARVSLDTGVPCSFGVLTVDNMEQALARTGDGKRHQGEDAARAVLRMAALGRELGSA